MKFVNSPNVQDKCHKIFGSSFTTFYIIAVPLVVLNLIMLVGLYNLMFIKRLCFNNFQDQKLSPLKSNLTKQDGRMSISEFKENAVKKIL